MPRYRKELPAEPSPRVRNILLLLSTFPLQLLEARPTGQQSFPTSTRLLQAPLLAHLVGPRCRLHNTSLSPTYLVTFSRCGNKVAAVLRGTDGLWMWGFGRARGGDGEIGSPIKMQMAGASSPSLLFLARRPKFRTNARIMFSKTARAASMPKDCEGFGSTESDKTRDAKLMSLCMQCLGCIEAKEQRRRAQGLTREIAKYCRLSSVFLLNTKAPVLRH